MTQEIVLGNARLVLEDEIVRGSVLIRDGRIGAVNSGRTAAMGTRDLEGDYLIPGLVELHTDHFEAHAFPRPDVRWPTMQALLAHDAAIHSAGITTVFDAIAVGHDAGKAYRKELCHDVLETLKTATDAGLLRIDHKVHLRCELAIPDMAEQFDRSRDHPLVHLISLMDHTPGQRQFVSLDKYRRYYMGKYDMQADDLERMIDERLAWQEKYAGVHRRHVTAWCRERGVTLASHDDATQAHVDQATCDGVTIAEFPTTLEAAQAASEHGLSTIMGAPNMVRGGSHSGNVAAGELARAGLLDAFSSDYVPISLLHAAWSLQKLGWTLPRALHTVTARPATMVGLSDRGRLATGQRADVVRITEHAQSPVVRQVWRLGQTGL